MKIKLPTAKDLLKKAETEVKKDIKAGKTVINTAAGKAQAVLTKATNTLKEDAVFAPLLPLMPSMIVLLSRKGVSTQGKGLGEVTRLFYTNILGGHYYEAYEVANLAEGELAIAGNSGKKGFDETNVIGAAAGAAAGGAAGLPPAVGGMVGSSTETIIKAVIAFFKNVAQKVKSGTANAEDKSAAAAMDETENVMTSGDAPTNVTTSGFNIAGIEVPKIAAYIIGLILVYIILKKTKVL